MAGPTNTRNANSQPSFNIRPVNNASLITPPATTTFSQLTEAPITLTSDPQQTGGGVNGVNQIQSDAVRQQTVNIFTEVDPGSSTPLSPLTIPSSVSGRTNVMEAMEGINSQPPRAPNASVGVTPNPIRLLTADDLGEDTFGLPQDVVDAGTEPATNLPSMLRPDIIACCKVNTALALGGVTQASKAMSLLSYMDDVYKLSLAQDTLRRTIIANKLAIESASGTNTLQTAFENIGDSVAADMSQARSVIDQLNSLITKTNRIREVFNVKQLLGSNPTNPNVVFRAPLTDLRDFATTRLLYTPETYESVSDTKLLYQMVSDAANVLRKCSFNLVNGFMDYDRSINDANTRTTVDAETYGNNAFSYVPALITAKYFVNAVDGSTDGNVAHTAFVGSLPDDVNSRVKFLFWLLTKELRVSKGLGKYLPQDAAQVFGGIAQVGNPFDNVFGAVPSSIYAVPAGLATVAGLFNVASSGDPGTSSNRSRRILPFENSNIDLVSYAQETNTAINDVVSGESIFLAQHLAGEPVLLRNYRALYTSRIQALASIMDRLLLNQQSSDPSSDVLTTGGMAGLVAAKTSEIVSGLTQANAISPTNALLVHMLITAQQSPQLRFELFKLLCLCYLYGTSEGDSTRFRTILFQELSSSPLVGGEQLTVDSLASLAAAQLSTVIQTYQGTLRQQPAPGGSSLQYDVALTTLTQVVFSDSAVQNILYAAQPNADPNPFAAIISIVKECFAACSSTDGFQYQLIPNSSLTRYTGLSSSGMILVVFELISGLLVELLGGGTASRTDDDLVRVYRGADTSSYIVSFNPAAMSLAAQRGVSAKVNDVREAVLQEEYFLSNVLAFLQRIGAGMETISDPSQDELDAIRFVNGIGSANAKVTFASVRTAKNNHRIVAAKLARINPNNQRLLNFYVDADNPDVSSADYAKLRSFVGRSLLATTANDDPVRTILSVGVPRGLLGTASDTAKDIITIRVYRLNAKQEDIIYRPVDFVFDMSLFPVGFSTSDAEHVSCVDISETTRVIAVDDLADLVRVDPFYTQRQGIARACLRNITNSYLLRTYINMMTGINVDDSSVRDIGSVASAIKSGFQTLAADGSAQLQTVLKEIQPRTYDGFLEVFQAFYGDNMAQGLILPLTRNIADFVFGSRLYDRVFNLAVSPSDFPIDSTRTPVNVQTLANIGTSGVVIDQYYVEIVTR